jgi:putative acetyltransferase
MSALPVKLEQVESPTDSVRLLIGELDAELNGEYAPQQRHGLSLDKIFQPNVMFFIAHLDGRPVGCGGVAFEDGFAEVKRMYVRPTSRGKGIAQAILARLESEARKQGTKRLTLETGDAQQSAMRFYERAGFTRCGAFGAYLTMQSDAIERSVFFERRIG